MALTTKQLQALKPGEWLSDGGARGAGALLFRRLASKKIVAYFRYTLPDGTRDTLTIGEYDEKGRDGLKLSTGDPDDPGMREKAGELSKLYQSGVRDLRGHFEAEALAKEAAKIADNQAKIDADEEALCRQRYTLKNLCHGYCDHLEANGKSDSARQARSILKVHVLEAFPNIAALPASEIDSDHIATLVRKVVEQGKERTAGVLRSYLSAAFNAARKARYDAKLPSAFIAYGMKDNPAEVIATIAVNRGQRSLSADELKKYLAQLGDDLSDQALALALYAGGQRMAQLLRAKVSDFDPDTKILRLWDGKGKRKHPREHLLPLATRGAAIVEGLIARAKQLEQAVAKNEERAANEGTLWLFSSYGYEPMVSTTPGKRAAEICEAMKCETFNLRDIRRTVETMLAGLKVSKDIRSQLLSHGISGVQDAHYDRHGYIDEKRATLIAWENRLEELASPKQKCT